ncbi:uncharacterized protein GGS25DRAFT_4024 [Hypoxylon fragiforme]|uniref:uncharacterized protein n=1 Tax=Hypoxylon fragiforme TaxID=63214 RepID=UPI0020C6D52D|nr:uncharacterized protein GGS25DRAFT_4024 [Hypoxylon fragiforme]KAI2613535.1 hypothetical protein GGS25DRAFT_4024 [Hypoxylon fragiforme]
MFVFVLLMLPLCGMALVQERYARVSVIRLKRQTASCDQMYGPGAEPCGGEGSNYCFNPTVGQSCCAIDRGFCDTGKYCAPVAGFCCLEGEDLATCAQNAGFTLPSNSTTPPTTDRVPADVTSMAGPTVTVVPFLDATSTPMPTPSLDDMQNRPTPSSDNMQNSTCSFTIPSPNSTTSRPTTISNINTKTNTTVPSVVEVSFGRKRVNPVSRRMLIVGIVCILTMFV